MFFLCLNLTPVKHFILSFILQNFEDVWWEKNFHKYQKIQVNKTQLQVLEALCGRGEKSWSFVIYYIYQRVYYLKRSYKIQVTMNFIVVSSYTHIVMLELRCIIRMVRSILCDSICFPSGFTQSILETNCVSHYHIELSRSDSYFNLLSLFKFPNSTNIYTILQMLKCHHALQEDKELFLTIWWMKMTLFNSFLSLPICEKFRWCFSLLPDVQRLKLVFSQSQHSM